MQKILEMIILGGTGAGTAVITAILTLFFGAFALLFTLVGVIVGYLIGLGIEDLQSMASGTDWGTLECILLCRLDENGQLDPNSLTVSCLMLTHKSAEPTRPS